MILSILRNLEGVFPLIEQVIIFPTACDQISSPFQTYQTLQYRRGRIVASAHDKNGVQQIYPEDVYI